MRMNSPPTFIVSRCTCEITFGFGITVVPPPHAHCYLQWRELGADVTSLPLIHAMNSPSETNTQGAEEDCMDFINNVNKSLSDLASFFPKNVSSKVVPFMENFALLAIGLHVSESRTDSVVHMVNFVKNITGTQSIIALSVDKNGPLNKFFRGNASVQDSFIDQADVEDPDDSHSNARGYGHLAKNWNDIRYSTWRRRFAYVIAALSAYAFSCVSGDSCIKKACQYVYKSTKWCASLTSGGFMQACLDILENFFKRVQRAYNEGSLYGFFKPVYPEETFHMRVVRLQTRYTHFENGNLELLGTSEQEYVAELEELYEQALRTKPGSANINGIKSYFDELSSLRVLKDKVCVHYKGLKTRNAPFSVLLFGPSGQGKTGLVPPLNKVIAHAMGLPTDEKYVCIRNMQEKYWSTLKSYTHTVVLDDMANKPVKLDKDGDFATTIIQTINTMPVYANMAAVESKGTILLKPEIVIGTTNVKNLCANDYSNEPYSLTRRFPYVVTVLVKPEYTMPSLDHNLHSVIDPSKVPPGPFPDIFECTLETVYPTLPNGCDHIVAGYTPYVHNDKRMVGVSISELVDCLIHLAKEHKKSVFKRRQDILMFQKGDMCDKCSNFVTMCKCVQEQSLTETLFGPDPCRMESDDQRVLADSYHVQFMQFVARNLPNRWGENAFVRFCLAMCFRPTRVWMVLQFIQQSLITNILWGIYMYYYGAFAAIAATVANGCMNLYIMYKVVDSFFTIAPNEVAVSLFAGRRSTRMLIAVIAAVGLLRIGFKFCKKDERSVVEQSDTEKPTERLSAPIPPAYATRKENVWKVDQPTPLTIPPCSRGASVSTVWDYVMATICPFVIHTGKERKKGTLCPIKSFYWLAPTHILEHMVGTFTIAVRVNERDWKVVNIVHRKDIDGTGLSLVSIPDMHLNRDLVKYHTTESSPECSQAYIPVLDEGSNWDECKYVKKLTGKVSYVGGVVPRLPRMPRHALQYSIRTKTGMCCVPVVAANIHPVILGYHVGGVDVDPLDTKWTTSGIAEVLTLGQLESALSEMEEHQPRMVIPHSEDLTSLVEDHEIVARLKPGIVTWSPSCVNVRFLGSSTKPTTKHRSKVRPTIISPMIEELLGVPNTYSAPPYMGGPNAWVGKQQNFDAYNTNPVVDICEYNLATSMFDRKVKSALSFPECCKSLKPLDRYTTLAGIQGSGTVLGMDLTTSVGWPYCSSKRNFISEVDDFPNYAKRGLVISDERLKESVDRDHEMLRLGGRSNAIFRAHLKDEVVSNTKTKVRSMCGGKFSQLYITRMYFLPIIAMLEDHWETYECLVGLNCSSKSWGDVYKYLFKFNTTNNVAGDFVYFDKETVAEELLFALTFLYSFAEASPHYTQDDLRVMRGVVTELVYSTLDFFGTIMLLVGKNASGNSLTAVINSIIVSFRMRYAWRILCRQRHQLDVIDGFDECVRMITYGDDHVLNVREDALWFNHTSISAVFATVGWGYTMADKTAESVPYVHVSDVTFLKRSFVWSSELSSWLAPLDLKSIHKALHAFVASDIPEEVRLMQCMHSQLLEMFQHGRDAYCKYRRVFQEIVSRRGWSQIAADFPDYDTRKQMYIEGAYAPDLSRPESAGPVHPGL